MTRNDFLKLFILASLNKTETEFFKEDITDALKTSFSNVSEYYKNAETQRCLIDYACDEWKDVAKSGLNKILTVV